MNLLENVNEDFKNILGDTNPEEQYVFLAEEMKKKDMQMEGKPFPTFLKPYFIKHAHREKIAQVTECIVRGIEKVGEAYMGGYDFEGLIQLHGREAELSTVDPLYPSYQVMVRLDLFYHPETAQLQFLEFNCGDPSGLGWHDAMLDIFLQLPVIKELSKKYRFRTDHLLETQLEAVMLKYGEYCERKGIVPREKPTCALVCKRDSTIRGDFDLIVEFYNNKGFQTLFGDPRDFDYDGNTLSLHGTPIEVVYRDAMDDFLKDEYWNGCQSIISAYKDGNICFVNPVRAATGDFKTLTAIMTDEKYKSLFTMTEWKIYQESIPWTRLLEEGKTDYKNRDIDIVPFIRKNKDNFVIKPNSGYGGFGVVIGKEADQDTWDKTIEKSLSPEGNDAVQEFVEIPVEEFPIIEDGKFKGFEPRNVNVNFWSHGGKFAGSFVRAASGSIINVHQGGGLVPAFFAG